MDDCTKLVILSLIIKKTLETDLCNAILLIFTIHFFAASAETKFGRLFALLISHVWMPYLKSVSKNDGSLPWLGEEWKANMAEIDVLRCLCCLLGRIA